MNESLVIIGLSVLLVMLFSLKKRMIRWAVRAGAAR